MILCIICQNVQLCCKSYMSIIINIIMSHVMTLKSHLSCCKRLKSRYCIAKIAESE